jgi:hypothetical protein
MFKKPGNPQIEELTKSCRERSIHLGSLRSIKVETEEKLFKCCWCAEQTFTSRQRKYCSQKCSDSAMAWAYPQKEHGLNALLARQEYKCNMCQFDYMPFVNQVSDYMRKKNLKVPDLKEEFSWYMIKLLKGKVPKERRIEVDHIVPISKGGQSLGLDNHQAICNTCHKGKTSKDNSGPRKKS